MSKLKATRRMVASSGLAAALLTAAPLGVAIAEPSASSKHDSESNAQTESSNPSSNAADSYTLSSSSEGPASTNGADAPPIDHSRRLVWRDGPEGTAVDDPRPGAGLSR
ncbi:hypothetical protein [Gordonia terrae]